MIIVTGVSGGIGKEVARELSRLDRVVGIYNNGVPDEALNKIITYEKVDLSVSKSIHDFIDKYRKELSKVTVIHFAAISIDGLAANYSEENWDKVFNVNLRGDFLLSRALIPNMIGEGWGRLIHVSSVVGMRGQVGAIAYAASKTGLVGMSNVFAKEYGRFNITSNVLVLGYFETGLIETLKEEEKKKIISSIPSKSLGKVNNITNAIDFLIKSEYVNGATINIDGAI